MVTREELRSHWNEVKSRLQQHWRELSDTELAHFNGTPSELIGEIQQKTGASWQEVESFLANAMRDGRSAAKRAGYVAERYGDGANQLARESYDQLAATTAEYSKKVARSVQRRPIESLAVAFGVGIAAGALMLLSSRRR